MKGRIAGKLRKRVWIKEGDVVLVSPWGFQDKCDVIHKYSDNEVDELVKKGVVSKDLIETLRR
jgi:Translation initiation factor 1 (IF-1)